MRLVDYLAKGASLGVDRPCLTMDGFIYRFARALQRDGVAPGEKIAVISGNNPFSLACVLGISRAAGVWCPINPRNEAAENAYLLELCDCVCIFFQNAYGPLVRQNLPGLPKVRLTV